MTFETDYPFRRKICY